jgi:putative ABC transport system permease protein
MVGAAKVKAVVSSVPLWRLGWQRLRQRPLQYVLCVVGIALGVVIVGSSDNFG